MDKRDFGLGVMVTVGTVVFAAATAWPFMNAWAIHEYGSYKAAEDWILHSAPMGELVGGHRAIEHDWFPKGGEDAGQARYQFKVSGDKVKVDLNVILAESGGTWSVTRAAWHDDDDHWHEITP